MSIFSQPLNRARLGGFAGAGAAAGAGVGALLAGRDRRKTGAVIGGAVGAELSVGGQAFGARAVMSLMHDARAFNAMPASGSGIRGVGNWLREAPNMLSNAAKYSWSKPNVGKTLMGDTRQLINRGMGFLNRFRK